MSENKTIEELEREFENFLSILKTVSDYEYFVIDSPDNLLNWINANYIPKVKVDKIIDDAYQQGRISEGCVCFSCIKRLNELKRKHNLLNNNNEQK